MERKTFYFVYTETAILVYDTSRYHDYGLVTEIQKVKNLEFSKKNT